MPPATITSAVNSSLLGQSCPRTPPPPASFARHPTLPSIPARRGPHHYYSRRNGKICCDAAITTVDASPSTSASLSEEETEALSRVGARVRVKVPLKVCHVQKVPELDLNGMEGEIKQFVGLWKGKRISANLPFKVQFLLPDGVEGRPGPLKFFAHLKEDEFEYISQD